jgi:hypothetical protein
MFVGEIETNMASPETVLARKELSALGPVALPVITACKEFGRTGTSSECSRNEMRRLINHSEGQSAGAGSKLERGTVKERSSNPNWEDFALGKDASGKNAEDNLEPRVGGSGTGSEGHKELFSPLGNSVSNSGVERGQLLKPQKRAVGEDFTPQDTASRLPRITCSRESPAAQGSPSELSADCQQVAARADDSAGRTCSGAEGSFPLSAERAQGDDVNKRKRKHRNKTRKERSTEEDAEGLQDEYVFPSACSNVLMFRLN